MELNRGLQSLVLLDERDINAVGNIENRDEIEYSQAASHVALSGFRNPEIRNITKRETIVPPATHNRKVNMVFSPSPITLPQPP